MSFVSQILERLGVIQSSDAQAASIAPAPPIPDVPVAATRHVPVPTPPAGSWSEGVVFDPEQTISSLDAEAAMDAEPFDDELTLVGDQREITVVGDTPPPAPTRSTRSVTLASLLAERGIAPDPDVAQLGLDVDISLDAPFDQAFSDAGLATSTHGWPIERVVQSVKTGRTNGLTPVQIRFKIEADVNADGATLHNVAADAAAKDEVLDALERSIQERVLAHDERIAERAESLQRQILALQAERADLLAQATADRNRFVAWQERKQHVEREWADALDVLAPFV